MKKSVEPLRGSADRQTAGQHFSKFMENPYIHGLKYIGRKDYPTTVRVLWALIFGASLAGLGYLSYQQTFSRKLSVVTTVSETRVVLTEYPFPAVTVCPVPSVSRSLGLDVLRKSKRGNFTTEPEMVRLLTTLQAFRSPLFSLGDLDEEALQYLGDMDVRETMRRVSPPCHLVFAGECALLNVEKDCCEMFHVQETNAGFCYSFNSCTSLDTKASDECVPLAGTNDMSNGMLFRLRRASDGASPDEDIPRGAVVTVHSPYNLPEPAGGTFLVDNDDLTGMVRVSLTVQDAHDTLRLIGLDERGCKFRYEGGLRVTRVYSQTNCLEDCRQRAIVERCHCLPFFFDITNIDKSGLATTEVVDFPAAKRFSRFKRSKSKLVLWTCAGPVPQCGAQGLLCVYNMRGTLRRTLMGPASPEEALGLGVLDEQSGLVCDCPPDCDMLLYDDETSLTSVSDDSSGDQLFQTNGTYATMYVYQRNRAAANIKYLKSARLSFSEFIANLGNIAALFLGVSVLSILEVCIMLAKCLQSLLSR